MLTLSLPTTQRQLVRREHRPDPRRSLLLHRYAPPSSSLPHNRQANSPPRIVQNGQPTGSVVATTAAVRPISPLLSPLTPSQETSVAATTSAASTTRATSGTPAATTKAATAGAPTSTTTPSGAGKVVASLLAGIVGVVGAVVLV